MNFGRRLRKLRKEKNITQKKLGEILGISEQAISNYERENRKPDTETLQKLSSIFSCSIDYLLGSTDERSPAHKIKEAVQGDPELQELWKRMQERDDLQLAFKQLTDLSPRDIREVMRVIERIQKEEYAEDY